MNSKNLYFTIFSLILLGFISSCAENSNKCSPSYASNIEQLNEKLYDSYANIAAKGNNTTSDDIITPEYFGGSYVKANKLIVMVKNGSPKGIEDIKKRLGTDSNVTFVSCTYSLQELKEFVREQIGGWKNEIRYKLDKYTYHIEFYDDELQLIYDFFKEVNTNKPEFLLAWNMRFDIPYIIARLEKLHVNPEDIICHPDFKKNKICRYYIDNQKGKDGKAKEIGKRGDKATIASYTTYLDQMIQFASRRTGQSAFSNMKLDYIGEVIANVRKLDYSHITTNIAKLPY